ncbi:MAG: cupin domain-containing protein [Ignavibacteria bacterium]
MSEINKDVSNLDSLKFDSQSSIQYQENSVVSKTIISKKSGTVTMFAFDKGQGLSEHTAPFDAMVFITDGEAEISIDGVSQIVKKDEILILPANKPHALNAVNKFKMLLIMIKS